MNLLRMLLVDDEAIILKGLESTYDWEGMGFEIVGTAHDGDIAVEKIKELKPDVVMTDVRMKRMSGLELMEKTAAFTDEVNFVVISAYKDFEYAQTACKQGALAYLVKPIDDEELETVMREVYEKCRKKISKKETYDKWRRLLLEDKESYLHLMRGRFLNDGITKETYEHIYQELKGTRVPMEWYAVVCADVDLSYKVVSPDDYDAKRYVLLSEIRKRFRRIGEVDIYRTSEGNPIFILRLDKPGKAQVFKQVIAQIGEELSCEVVSAMSQSYRGLEGMRKAYTQAQKLFDIALEAGAGLLTMPEKVPEKMEEVSENQYSIDIETQVLSAMRKNDREQLKENFVTFIYHLPESEKLATIYLHRLIVRVEFWIGSTDDAEEYLQEFGNFYAMLGKYPCVTLIDIAYKLLVRIQEKREEKVSESEGTLFEDYMRKAQAYIEEHLHEEDLSISQVAGWIYLNPVYFGRVFKNAFGVSFKRYVRNRRMELAKALILNGNESIAVICEKVGIPNPSYFSKLFKQYTGELPSDYKRNMIHEG